MRYLIIAFFLFYNPASLAQQAVQQSPELPVSGYVLLDYYSGRVLAAQNSRQRMEPASITKIMTAYLVYKGLNSGSLKPDEFVRISETAWRVEGSRMFVEVDSRVKLDDLLMGVVVQSGNDATIALAEHIAGSETAFAALMNKEAEKLGLNDTHYVNSTGLPHEDHYTTPLDIALLSRAMIREFPDHYASYAKRSFTYNNIEQHNRNKLLWRDDSVDGIKTGHTRSAGFCLAASAKRGDMRLISVVLGAEKEKDRFTASEELLNYGFRNFQTYKLYNGGHILTEARVWKGAASGVPLGFLENIYVTIPKKRYHDMRASLRVNSAIEAPVDQGQSFGSVIVRLDDKIVADIPLVSITSVAEGGFASRLTDEVLLTIFSLFN